MITSSGIFRQVERKASAFERAMVDAVALDIVAVDVLERETDLEAALDLADRLSFVANGLLGCGFDYLVRHEKRFNLLNWWDSFAWIGPVPSKLSKRTNF